MLKRD